MVGSFGNKKESTSHSQGEQQRYLFFGTHPFHGIFRMLSASLKKEETPSIFKLIELILFS